MTGKPKGVVEGAKDITNMKKTYIQPENTVVTFNAEHIICESIVKVENGGGVGVSRDGTGSVSISSGDAREVIKSQDPWEEW